MPTLMPIGHHVPMTEEAPVATISSLAWTWYHGPLQSRKSFLEVALSLSTVALLLKLLKSYGYNLSYNQTKDLGKLKYFLGKCGYVTKEVCLRHLGRNRYVRM